MNEFVAETRGTTFIRSHEGVPEAEGTSDVVAERSGRQQGFEGGAERY
jgi:hypothetical protein